MAKRRAAASVALPLPAATSSTRSPAQTSAASLSSSPTICSVVPMTAKSPDAHIACCFAFTDGGGGSTLAATDSHVITFVIDCLLARRLAGYAFSAAWMRARW